MPADERAHKKARQGVPYVVSEEMRVVDEQMQDAPRDAATMGEVIMRGNNVMKGYYEQPEATDETFRDGCFHSGDLAVMHPNGYIELRDRRPRRAKLKNSSCVKKSGRVTNHAFTKATGEAP